MWFIETTDRKFQRPTNCPPLEKEPLFVHRRTQGKSSQNLLVFVHGLGGDRYGTWEDGLDENQKTKSFPRFIYEEEDQLQDVDVGLYSYVTGIKRIWKPSIDLEREAKILADILRDADDYKQIVLLGHSMGGVVIKAAIADLIDRHDRLTLERISGLFLLATPQIGSLRIPIPSLLKFLHRDLKALQPHGKTVTRITQIFQRSIVESFNGSREDSKKYVIPAWAVLAAEDYWVDELSAGLNLPDDRRKDVRGSHVQVVKPAHKDEDAYAWVVKKITACFKLALDEAKSALENLLNQYPLKPAPDLNPYDILGVAKSEHVDRFQKETGEYPPYIPRKKTDAKLDRALKTSRFILLTGRSKSGKTRTAFEAVKRNLPYYYMLVPARPGEPAQLTAILKEYEKISAFHPDTVLWLDDMERFIDVGIFNVNLINRILGRHKSAVIVGTMRSSEYIRLTSIPGEIGRAAQHTLDHAVQILLAENLETEEKQIAQKLYGESYPDLNFEIPIGETFVAASRLKARFEHGCEGCPEGVAIVTIAIDFRRAGIDNPISESWLREMYPFYLRQLEPLVEILDDGFQKGLNWAITPIERYSALLVRMGNKNNIPTFTVPDYLIEYLQEKPAPNLKPIWEMILRNYHEFKESLTNIGYNCYMENAKSTAKAMWTKGMQLESKNSAFNLGVLLTEEGDFEGSNSVWTKAIELGHGKAAFNLGTGLFEKGDFDKAKIMWTKAVDLGEGEAAFNLGLLLKKQADLEGAKTVWTKGINMGDSTAAAALGQLLIEQGNFEGAHKMFLKSLEMGERRAAAHLGLLLKEKGNLQEAEAIYQKGVELGEGIAAYLFGILLEEKGDLEGAKIMWTKGMELGDGMSARELGRLLKESGDLEGAKIMWTKGMELGDGKSTTALGLLLKESGDLKEAKKMWSKGMELGDGWAATIIGSQLKMQGDLEGAKAMWLRAIELGDGAAASHLGFLLKEQNDLKGAKSIFTKGVELGKKEAAFNLGLVHSEEGNLEEAKLMWTKAVEWGYGTAAYNLGVLLLEEADLIGAKAMWTKGLQLGDSTAALNLGRLLETQGHLEEAKEVYKKGVTLGIEECVIPLRKLENN